MITKINEGYPSIEWLNNRRSQAYSRKHNLMKHLKELEYELLAVENLIELNKSQNDDGEYSD